MTINKIYLVLLLLLSFTFLSTASRANAVFTTPTPNNVIYADDFENYTVNQKLGCNNTQGYPDGWGWIDCATGGTSNITSTAYFSCCKSIVTGSPNSANAVFDVDKRFPLNNSTRRITLSIWFAVSLSYVNQNLNNAHISMETWDAGNRYEAALFLYSSTAGTCNPGIKLDWVGSDSGLGPGGTDHVATSGGGSTAYCLQPYNKATAARGIWHHYVLTVDTIAKRYISASVDGFDFTYTVCPTTCAYFSNHGGGGDNELAQERPVNIWRFEIGAVNAATHTLPTDTWAAWHDDLLITDTTPGTINCGVQFFANSGQQPSTTVNPGCVNVTTNQIGILTGILASIVLVTLYYAKRRKQVDLLKQVRV